MYLLQAKFNQIDFSYQLTGIITTLEKSKNVSA